MAMPDMLYQEKVAWLWRYRDGLKKQRILQQHIQELRALAERITPTISPTPGGGGDGNAMARAVENMAKAQQDLADQVEHCNQIRAEVSETIDKVDKARDREILARRYILGEKFEQIAVHMLLEYRWVRRCHNRAVRNLKIDPPRPH